MYANNVAYVGASTLSRSIVYVFIPATIVFLGITIYMRNIERAFLAYITSFAAFFSFGYLTQIMLKITPAYRQETTFLTLILLTILIVFINIKMKRVLKTPKVSYTFLLVVLASLFVLPVTQIIRAHTINHENLSSKFILGENSEIYSTGLPDIYYIILDGHARSDILTKYYEFDNSHFIANLKHIGFFVGNKSTSNYSQTLLSMAASLNMDYIDNLITLPEGNSTDRGPLLELIRNNKVQDVLYQHGYKSVVFKTGWAGTDDAFTADITIIPPNELSEFDVNLLQMTPLGFIFNNTWLYNSHKNAIDNILDKLPTIPSIQSPTFTYAHILLPHPPFIYKRDGTYDPPDEAFRLNDATWKQDHDNDIDKYRELYIEQLLYVDAAILNTINDIIRNSESKPIIILQSDHGPGSLLYYDNPTNDALIERQSILNAYYIPNNDTPLTTLYEHITPVNTFRVILNHLLGTNIDIIQDNNYFSPWDNPYQFQDTTHLLSPENK